MFMQVAKQMIPNSASFFVKMPYSHGVTLFTSWIYLILKISLNLTLISE